MFEFLRYLFLGKFEISEDIDIVEFYKAANYYQVDRLQEKCIYYIESRASDQNVFDILQFAHNAYEQDLYYYCLAMISS